MSLGLAFIVGMVVGIAAETYRAGRKCPHCNRMLKEMEDEQ